MQLRPHLLRTQMTVVDQNLIASQMADQDFDVIIGGGLKYFLPKNISGE